MAELDISTLTPQQLGPMLRCWAAGMENVEAGVELLIAHRYWLERADFRASCITADDEGWSPDGTICSIATIDWAAVADTAKDTDAPPAAGSMLRLACALADGRTHAVALGKELQNLDRSDVPLILEAVAHTTGWHHTDAPVQVTGTFEQ
ncbi:hypothetical protein AB0F43_07870 [Kribbella sp. NPDC023972]|uniref:hypothetical protein n=1 Tax=Kribbella sp. NPDC023972 TaxID=3154795 RepID=UPI0033D0E197